MRATEAGHSPDPKHRMVALELTKEELQQLFERIIQQRQIIRENRDHIQYLQTLHKQGTAPAERLAGMESNNRHNEILLEKDYEVLAGRLASVTSNAPHVYRPRSSFFRIKEAGLEEETRRVFRTARAVSSALKSGDFDLDYSPAVMCLAKAFEREVNLSVVHWVRKELGIEMPAFFDRWSNSKGKYEFDDINFNLSESGDKQTWRPPMLGQSERAIRLIASCANGRKCVCHDWLLGIT